MTENSSFIPSVNSYFISPADVILIIKKLEMYKDEEIENINDIKGTLIKLQEDYLGKNDKIIKTKLENLFQSLDTMLENRKKCITFLSDTVRTYIDANESTVLEYHKKISDINQ